MDDQGKQQDNNVDEREHMHNDSEPVQNHSESFQKPSEEVRNPSETHEETFGNVPNHNNEASEGFGNAVNHVEEHTEGVGNLPKEARNDSEHFGNDSEESQKHSEDVGNVRKEESTTFEVPERTEHHTITVREAARQFEEAQLPVTERTIVNWCRLNKRGVRKLDCYYDERDFKYFITPQSIDKALKEERVKRHSDYLPYEGSVANFPNDSETQERPSEGAPQEEPKGEEVLYQPEQPAPQEEAKQTRESSPAHDKTVVEELEKIIQELNDKLHEKEIESVRQAESTKYKDSAITSLGERVEDGVKRVIEDREEYNKQIDHLIGQSKVFMEIIQNKDQQIEGLNKKLLQLSAPQETPPPAENDKHNEQPQHQEGEWQG